MGVYVGRAVEKHSLELYTKSLGSRSAAAHCSAGEVMGVSADVARMILGNVKVKNLYNDAKDDVALCSWMLRFWWVYGIIDVLLTTEQIGPIRFHEKNPWKFLSCYNDRTNGC